MSEAIAYILLTFFIMFLGRKLTLSVSLFAAAVCFLLSLISWKWTEAWNLERLLALVVIVWISIGFAQLFLYAGELAPTYLRGYTLSTCSLLARAGSVLSIRLY